RYFRAAPMALRDTPAACPALWRWLRCPPAELRLDLVLASGQAFRWRESSPGAWTGVLGDRVWTLRQERDRLWYTVYGKETPGPETDQILWDYFQLDVGLAALYRAWGAADPLFCQPATAFPGGTTSQARHHLSISFITRNKIEMSIWKILFEHAGGQM
uniref:8-oxoguanine DNA glycosylase N-terminal domain-containing protein n=1 Tax=Phasianus colchicus TaxID=9054 RepID=A0A669P0D1_PHACC